MGNKNIIIVGAGVMGTSAALAMKRKHPEYTVYLINDDNSTIEPASRDLGKIIRSAYVSNAYVNLAKEAIEMWKAEPLYENLFHQCGWIVVDTSPEEALSDSHNFVPSGPREQSKESFLVQFPRAEMNKIASLSHDPTPAWVDASRALETTVKIAESTGVIVLHSKVSRLLWNGLNCTGVALDSGSERLADSVLLAAGPGTPSLLGLPSIGNCVGVSLLGVQLSDAQYELYKDMPILAVNGLGEILPPNRDKIMKCNNSKSFSVPDISRLEEALPLTAKSPYFDENLEMLYTFMPDLKDAPVVYRRYCLDYLTEKHDFHIGPVDGHDGVYVAFGGSFHGWKFLPNIGDYIVRMMDGDQFFFKEWKRWSGAAGSGDVYIHEDVIPKRAFPDRA